MPLDSDKIYRYNFKSESNLDWNFQLEFLRGKNAEVGTYASEFIPADAFVDDIVVLNSYKDDLPLGLPEIRTLKLNVSLSSLVDDWLELRNWIMFGGQLISNKFYPNQWRLLSNNGRGASDVNYNIVEFWGAQNYTPVQKYEGSFGNNNLILELNIFGVENFLLNKTTNLFGLYLILLNNSSILPFEDIDSVYQFRKQGTNTSSQTVDVRVANDYNKQTATFHHIDDINYAINLFIKIETTQTLRKWLNKKNSSDTERSIYLDNLFTKHFTFYKQTNTLSKNAGTALAKNEEMLNVFIRDLNNNVIGGLFSEKSKNSINQYKTFNDFINSLGENFINKYIFSYLNLDETITAPYFGIINTEIFSDYTQIQVDKNLTLNQIVKYEILDKNYLINFAKTSWYAIGDNQKSTQIDNGLSLINDSHEFKSFNTTALQVPKLDEITASGEVTFMVNNEMPINQIYYDYQTSDAILVHTKTDLDLGDSIVLNSNETSTGNFDFTRVSDNTQKWSNWRDLIVYQNSMNNTGGLNYMQCKAINKIYNVNAKYTKLEVIDYAVRQVNLGSIVTLDLNTLSEFLPSGFYATNKNIIVKCETNYRNGKSEVVLYTRG